MIGIFGALASWIAGNTRLPFVIGLDHYLPPAFAKLHPRWATPYISILYQPAASIVLLAPTQAGETMTAAYQILVDMTVISTFLPYLYIFGAGWKFGQRLAPALGLAISPAAIGLSIVPPPEVRSWKVFEAKVMGGCLLLNRTRLAPFRVETRRPARDLRASQSVSSTRWAMRFRPPNSGSSASGCCSKRLGSPHRGPAASST